jgi:hypothetical protein
MQYYSRATAVQSLDLAAFWRRETGRRLRERRDARKVYDDDSVFAIMAISHRGAHVRTAKKKFHAYVDFARAVREHPETPRLP